MWHVTIAGLLTGHAQAADFVKTGLCLAQNCKVSMHCPVVTALPARWCITLEYHLPLQAELANHYHQTLQMLVLHAHLKAGLPQAPGRQKELGMQQG